MLRKFSTHEKWFLLVLLSALWGSSFILMKFGMRSFPPEQVAALRISVAFIVMIPVFFKIGLRECKWKDLPLIFLVGLMANTIPPFLFCFAQTGISSAFAGILNALTPLFVLLIGILFFGYRSNIKKSTGIIIGLLGSTMLILLNNKGKFQFQFNQYASYILGAALLYGIGANILKNKLSHIHPLTLSALLYILTGYLGLLFLSQTNFIQLLQTQPEAYSSLGYIIFLGCFCTAFAMIIFNYLLRKTSVVFASTVTYLMPVFSLFWGFIDGEAIALIQIAGLIVILIGVYLSSR